MMRLCCLALLSTAALVAQTPRIDSITPNQGPIAGGTQVAIRGANLDVSRISLDDAPITPAFVSASEIRFTMPSHDNGYASISAQLGSAVAYTEFLYMPPALRDLPPGTITTVAGIGSYYGNGRQATAAVIAATNLVTDAAGNTYVEEPGRNWVRRIRPDGVIEPFIGTGVEGRDGDGGPALKAQLWFPRGIALDAAGNIYIGDYSQRVRRVDAKTGIITTIAGTGVRGFSGDGGPALSAQFNEPTQIAVDRQNNIYVLDCDNYRIRKITPDGIIRTVAGTGDPGFSGDGGPALQAQFDTLFGGDSGGLAVDPSGNVYLADTGNQRVRKIDAATGLITTIAKGAGVQAVLADPQGNLWFDSDDPGHSIVRISPAGAVLESYGDSWGFSPDGTDARKAAFSFINRLGLDGDGNLLVVENYSLIRRINRVTGILETAAGTGPGIPGENGPALATLLGDGINDLQVLPGGELLAVDIPRLRKIDQAGNISTIAGYGFTIWNFTDNQPATQVSFGGLTAAKADAEGNIWVTACCMSLITQIDRAGIVHWRFGQGPQGFGGDGGPARDALLDQPWDLHFDAAGNLLIADSNNNRVRKVDAKTSIITTIAGSGPVNGQEGYGRGTSCGDGGPATQACINTPYGLALDRDGVLYIAENDVAIRRVDPNGIITTFARMKATKMTLDAAGNLYTVDENECSVVRILPDGTVIPIAGGNGPGFGGDGGPALAAHITSQSQGIGIAIDEEGNLFFDDVQNHRIRAIRYGAVLAPWGARVQVRGGTPQSSAIGTKFGDALAVFVGDSAGAPAGNVRVDFDAPPGGASCLFSNQQAHIGVLTDRHGLAAAVCTANTATGAFVVTAVPLGTAASLKFALTNTAPQMASNGVVNGASFVSGAVAPGEIVTVFGAGVGPQQLVQATPGADGRFGTQLSGVRVRFNGVEAPVLFARFDQAGVVVPYAVDGATSAQVVVEYAGVPSNPVSLPVAPASPAIFSSGSTGRGQGAILNEDGSPNSAANPADRGAIVVLFATGEGQTDPPGEDGQSAREPYPKPRQKVSVTIGGQPADILYAGAAPTLVAGVLQINTRVPTGITPGASVPVVLAVGTSNSPPTITIAVR
jgi:uncharacterized protein (TIGR03437 family)